MSVPKLKTINAAELQRMSDEELAALSMKEGDYMTDKQYPVCPIMKNACITGCMWFKDGECCIASLPDLVDKLEDVVASVEALEQTVKNKDFQG